MCVFRERERERESYMSVRLRFATCTKRWREFCSAYSTVLNLNFLLPIVPFTCLFISTCHNAQHGEHRRVIEYCHRGSLLLPGISCLSGRGCIGDRWIWLLSVGSCRC